MADSDSAPLVDLRESRWEPHKQTFVTGSVETPAGSVPIVSHEITSGDRLGTFSVRLGIGRDSYTVVPGLYSFGSPDEHSPLVATCNYKLTFDLLRREWKGLDLWVLALDTKGINVWCAAGKGTFGTQELLSRMGKAGVDRIVAHREVVLPQLGASGVNAHEVRKGSGFRVFYGPVRADDLKTYLDAGKKATPAMRRVTFTTVERLILIPVELSLLFKYSLWILPAGFALSGISKEIWSPEAAWARGWLFAASVGAGAFAGAFLTPLLLPWLPGKSFSVRGIFAGLATTVGAALLLSGSMVILERTGFVLMGTAVASFAAMNFTGATPITSPTGVEKEMRRFLPVQLMAAAAGLIAWIGGGFFR
ncbi:hypothetical protein EPN96_02790 [bacterium]|nr:MAG: hypothetical protein EPN96_02790 [bacterium]